MPNHVLFEIGLEELPARFIDEAEAQLKSKTIKWLKDIRIPYEKIETFSTPRRLSVLIKGVKAEQKSLKEEVRGPSVKIAKDKEGNWSKAAIGFTKGQGKITEDIYIKEVKETPYIFVKKLIEGKPVTELLPSFKEIVESISFSQTMRWGSGTTRYARPIRWLIAIYNDEIIPFEIAGVVTSNMTYGHRFLGGKPFINNPLEYEEVLHENFVIANSEKRKELIQSQIKDIVAKENFHISVDDKLLNEVTNLVEYPTAFSGSYGEEFLELPSEVLITSMKEHQRYFPVYTKEDSLLPRFISVRNGNDYEIENVVKGNEKVLHARLTDAQFFYEEDLKQSINFYQEKLEKVIFQEKLGSLKDKVMRVKNITQNLCDVLNVNQQVEATALRVAEICKFDLVTNMVNEFPELQGVIGEKYALQFGESKDVAKGVREHYLPIHANGDLPQTMSGSIVSIADKLDTIIGFLSVGLVPTGSQDPYGLRRQALGVLRIFKEQEFNITLESIIKIAQKYYNDAEEKTKENISQFFKLRANFLLKEMNIEQDIIDASIYKEIGFLPYTISKAKVLSNKRNDEKFKSVQEALTRVLNLAKSEITPDVEPSLFETESEEQLFNKLKLVNEQYKETKENQEATLGLESISSLAPFIHDFFDNNMVMAENEAVRANRLALINMIAKLIIDYADLSKIQWNQQQ